ncbi:MAG: 1-(5-phosphoribosyl)-5-[(5-phosphoribosylamino)methylideneamino] imidazole-4-carboxamide isomerase, partial [Christensenellales bacterium]
MVIFPAIDLMDGEAVRLFKGDFAQKEVFSKDPSWVLEAFKKSGAEALHIVDLDGAKSGSPRNFEVIKKLVSSSSLFTEVGGGIRSEEQIESYLSLGVGRVVIGTKAVKDEKFLKSAIKKYREKIAVGVDSKDGFAAVEGWQKSGGIKAFELVERCRDLGCENVVFTDISTDGAMAGTNLDAFLRLSQIDGIKITASGGITREEEIAALR